MRTALVLVSFALLIGASAYAIRIIWSRAGDGRAMAASGALFLLNTFAMGAVAATEDWGITLAVVTAQVAASAALLRAA